MSGCCIITPVSHCARQITSRVPAAQMSGAERSRHKEGENKESRGEFQVLNSLYFSPSTHTHHFFFSTLPSIGPHTPWKPLRKYSFCLHCSSQNASWTSVIIFTTEYFKKPWKPVSCTLSRCTETAFQLVCISSSMYGITDSHHAWTSEKLRIITLGPLLVPEGPVCDKIGVSCISKQYIQTFCILLSPLSGRSHRKKMAV